MSAWAWIAVALVGGVGALARVSLDSAIGTWMARRLADDRAAAPSPQTRRLRLLRDRASGLALGTFVINVSGSFLLGLLDGLGLTGTAATIFATATVGAYTTFSTWMLQSATLRADGLRRAAALNIVLSVLAGFAAVLLGHVVGAACA